MLKNTVRVNSVKYYTQDRLECAILGVLENNHDCLFSAAGIASHLNIPADEAELSVLVDVLDKLRLSGYVYQSDRFEASKDGKAVRAAICANKYRLFEGDEVVCIKEREPFDAGYVQLKNGEHYQIEMIWDEAFICAPMVVLKDNKSGALGADRFSKVVPSDVNKQVYYQVTSA